MARKDSIECGVARKMGQLTTATTLSPIWAIKEIPLGATWRGGVCFPLKQENEARCIFLNILGMKDSFENLIKYIYRPVLPEKCTLCLSIFCISEKDNNMTMQGVTVSLPHSHSKEDVVFVLLSSEPLSCRSR